MDYLEFVAIRPSQGNRSRGMDDPVTKEKI